VLGKVIEADASKEQMFSRQFWILNLGSIVFMSSFSMIIPELPEYLANMGGEQYIGFIIGLFTISAGFSRPFSGKLTDTVGRVKVMIFGSIITTICGFLYMFTVSIWAFLALRLLHGLSTGFRPTGATTLLTDIVPRSRRGEAMGYLGMAGSTGMAIGPSVGSFIKEEFSFEAMFVVSSLLGVLSIVLTFGLKESLKVREKFKLSHLKVNKHQLVEKSAFPPSVVMMLDTFSFGAILTIAPDFVKSLGFHYKGLFNTTFVVSSIFMRFVAGRASDRYGRIPVLIVGTVFLIISLFTLSMTTSQFGLIAGGILYGVSIGINRPTVFAWTADTANPLKIGMALSTMLLALEIGIGAGAFTSGYLYAGDLGKIPFIFKVSAISAGLSLIYLIFFASKHGRKIENQLK